MEIKTRNVNTAFQQLVHAFAHGWHQTDCGARVPHDKPVRRKSRNGDVLMIDEPVTVCYERPAERVLLNPARDANPFMHVYESLWMLAGRNDVAPLTYYAKKFLDYSDDGVTLNGAYGYRWRYAQGTAWSSPARPFTARKETDQLGVIVSHLKADPDSRRAVLQMWNVEDDLLKIGFTTGSVDGDCDTHSLDVCCNLSVLFSTRPIEHQNLGEVDRYLDMTVFNRSNDLVWGLLGANAVHFSFLQEYVAARLGASVGRMRTVTNNLHVYTWNWKPEEWLAPTLDAGAAYNTLHDASGRKHVPLVRNPAAFEEELPKVVDGFRGKVRAPRPDLDSLTEPFLRTVAAPMLRAHELHKTYRETETALRMCDQIADDAWRLAAVAWLERRYSRAR